MLLPTVLAVPLPHHEGYKIVIGEHGMEIDISEQVRSSGENVLVEVRQNKMIEGEEARPGSSRMVGEENRMDNASEEELNGMDNASELEEGSGLEDTIEEHMTDNVSELKEGHRFDKEHVVYQDENGPTTELDGISLLEELRVLEKELGRELDLEVPEPLFLYQQSEKPGEI